MKAIIGLLVCLAVGCFAQRPQPCRSPPFMTGYFTLTYPKENLFAYAEYIYDGIGERIRVKEIVTYDNKTFFYDGLMHFREHVIYLIDERNRTCTKQPLTDDFRPMEVPHDATLLGEAILGTSSREFEGLLVNTWGGEVPEEKAKYITTFTAFGCIPVSTVYHTNETGWTVTSFFDNVIGIIDPEELIPPSFCQGLKHKPHPEPYNFYSLFRNH